MAQANQAIPATTPLTYAQQVNSKYSNNASIFVNIEQRLKDAINSLPHFKQIGLRGSLKQAMDTWQNNFSHIQKFKDLQLVECYYKPLRDLLIDTTMQRKLDMAWVMNILKKFLETQAQPIQVYRVSFNYTPIYQLEERGA